MNKKEYVTVDAGVLLSFLFCVLLVILVFAADYNDQRIEDALQDYHDCVSIMEDPINCIYIFNQDD